MSRCLGQVGRGPSLKRPPPSHRSLVMIGVMDCNFNLRYGGENNVRQIDFTTQWADADSGVTPYHRSVCGVVLSIWTGGPGRYRRSSR